jgi:hypothetical protein
MIALVELALAIAAQYTLNRQVASFRAESHHLVIWVTAAAAVSLIAMTGIGFMLAALYEALLEHYDTPEAAMIMGGVLLAIAAVVVVFSVLRARWRAAHSMAIPTLPARTVAEREAEAVIDEFKKVLGSASPLAITAAVAGLAIGLAGAKLGQAVRANGARPNGTRA